VGQTIVFCGLPALRLVVGQTIVLCGLPALRLSAIIFGCRADHRFLWSASIAVKRQRMFMPRPAAHPSLLAKIVL
jgi:hypothetical protein